MRRLLTDLPRILFSCSLLVLNTLVCCLPLLALVPVRLLLPKRLQLRCRHLMGQLGKLWVEGNRLWIGPVPGWQAEGLDALPKGSCLVICNHQSWVDILVLQHHFNRRLPLLRFFIKQQLIWLPVVGLCCWALDFPFMRRHSKEYLARHPEQRGKDLETTRSACAKLREVPVALINFCEGTRFTEAKHAAQQSPYKNLLKPRAGGIAMALDAMGDQFEGLVDVTLVYPEGRPTFVDLLAGRVERTVMAVQVREIPRELVGRRCEDEDFKLTVQKHVNSIWSNKERAANGHKQTEDTKHSTTKIKEKYQTAHRKTKRSNTQRNTNPRHL